MRNLEELIRIMSERLCQLTPSQTTSILCGSIVAAFLLTIRLYCRLTVGKCKCLTTMANKTVIITGANTGIGRATAEELAKRGARVILACRNEEQGQIAAEELRNATGNVNVLFKPLDLCSFASIRRFINDFNATENGLDVLINNAGILGTADRQTTVDGYERVFQTNHLGHFLLTSLLLDALKNSSSGRIINVTSNVYSKGKLNFQDLQSEASYNLVNVYYNSKFANVLFTRELAKRLKGTSKNIAVNCAHPGVVQTTLSKEYTGLLLYMTKFIVWLTGKTSVEGAQTILHLVFSQELNSFGNYYADCKQQKMAKHALDEVAAERLWAESESMISAAESNKSR